MKKPGAKKPKKQNRHIYKRTSICLNPPVEGVLERLSETETATGRIANVCDRYIEIVKHAKIDEKFSEDDLAFLAKNCQNWMCVPAQAIMLLDGAVSTMEGAGELVRKIQMLDYAGKVALVEAIETHKRKGQS